MIQGGDPNTKGEDKSKYGQGGPGYTIDAEFNGQPHVRGAVSMARGSDPNSAGSQFFIVVADARYLDHQYTVFGRVVKGMDVADTIAARPRDGNDLPLERIEILENWVQHDLRPDLTLLLDLPVATGLKRAGKREQLADRFEAQKQAFFENVRQCYLDRAVAEPGRFHVIDASKTLDQVQTSLRDTLQRFVAQHGERT